MCCAYQYHPNYAIMFVENQSEQMLDKSEMENQKATSLYRIMMQVNMDNQEIGHVIKVYNASDSNTPDYLWVEIE